MRREKIGYPAHRTVRLGNTFNSKSL